MRDNKTLSRANKPKVFERLHQELKQYKLKYKGCIKPQDNHEQLGPTNFWLEEKSLQPSKDYSMTL